MTTQPQIRIYNSDNTFVDRDMNESELAQYAEDQKRSKAEQKAETQYLALKAAAHAKLAALGLTLEEINSL